MKTLRVVDKSFRSPILVAFAVALSLGLFSTHAQTPKRVGLQMPVDPNTGIPLTQAQLQRGPINPETGLPPMPPPITEFRVVNGQPYNIRLSNLWKVRTFEYVRREKSLIIAKEITFNPVYDKRWFPGDPVTERESIGAGSYSGSAHRSAGYRDVLIRTDRIVGPRVAITNLTRKDLAVGKDFKIATMIVETTATNRLILHDVGTLYTPGQANSTTVSPKSPAP